MTTQRDKTFDSLLIGSLTVDAAIRIGLLGLFLYWSLKVIGPFLTVALWSAIITVALYPLFDWLAARLGSRRLAAALITLLCLVIVIGPVMWLGFGLIGSVDFMMRGFDSKIFSIPLPAESVRDWPLIGEQAYRLWTLAATDIKTILLEVLPGLKPLGGKLLDISGTVVLGLLEFVAAIGTAMETANALMFTAYMVPVSLVDNVLRPFVMAHGLTTPMPVILIGVVGGTLAYGISGLFLGPVVLSVGWALLVSWVHEDSAG